MHQELRKRLIRRSSLPVCLMLLPLLMLFPARSTNADEIALWNFNDSNLIVDRGAGTLTTDFNPANVAFAAGTATNAQLGDPAGQALSLQGGTSAANNGRNITFIVSTMGFSNITISFATQGSGTGFTSNQFQYSLDGLTFVDFGLAYTPASAFGTTPMVFDLSSITGLNNNPNAVFRIIFSGATSATGSNRIDNLAVSGANSTVPEPTALLLLGTGLSSLVALHRRARMRKQE